MSIFKVGDQVKILRKVRSHTNGWKNTWVSDMDVCVGKIGTVISEYDYQGICVRVPGRPSVFVVAQNTAVYLGQRLRYVTAEQVQDRLIQQGKKPSDLGNAAGMIFRNKNWKDTGKTVKSNRPESRRRKITVWEYVGA